MSQISSDILSLDDQNFLYESVDSELTTFLGHGDILLGSNEDIKDFGLYPYQPDPQNVLSKEQYPGPFHFHLEIDNTNSANNVYMYSKELNKVYTKMTLPIHVGFHLKSRPEEQLFIRATPVYSSAQFAQEGVYRCINHAFSNNDGVDAEHVRQHIIRCSNLHAQYIGDKNKNERLSVLFPLSEPQTGTDSVKEIFRFVCQNSCPAPGMNRRGIEIIFTLENRIGHILGRETFNVRVCCSPKRDMQKDHNDLTELNSTSKGKKRKMEKPIKKELQPNDVDTKEYTITVPIIGKHNVQYVLKYCQDLMAGEIVKHKNKPTEEVYKSCHDQITNLKDSVE